MSSTASPTQPESAPPSGYHAPTHGSWAQWFAIGLTFILGVATLGMTIWFHQSSKQSQTDDEHVNGLIDAKVNPATKELSKTLTDQFSGLSNKLGNIDSRLSKVEGQIEQYNTDQRKISERIDRQGSLARLIDPSRVLATIRAELQIAQSIGAHISPVDLVDYKNVIRELPKLDGIVRKCKGNIS